MCVWVCTCTCICATCFALQMTDKMFIYDQFQRFFCRDAKIRATLQCCMHTNTHKRAFTWHLMFRHFSPPLSPPSPSSVFWCYVFVCSPWHSISDGGKTYDNDNGKQTYQYAKLCVLPYEFRNKFSTRYFHSKCEIQILNSIEEENRCSCTNTEAHNDCDERQG